MPTATPGSWRAPGLKTKRPPSACWRRSTITIRRRGPISGSRASRSTAPTPGTTRPNITWLARRPTPSASPDRGGDDGSLAVRNLLPALDGLAYPVPPFLRRLHADRVRLLGRASLALRQVHHRAAPGLASVLQRRQRRLAHPAMRLARTQVALHTSL